MPKKPETIIEDTFVDMVREGKFIAIALKLVLIVGRGFPDRTIIGNGKCFFIEFKTPTGDTRKKQTKWKTRLEQLGMKVYVCTSAKEAYEIFIEEMEST